MAEPLLEISDLTLEFGPISNPVRVLNHVSLSVAAGEAVGLVGESGSGKSMTSLATMRLLPASARLTSGRIRLEGHGDLLALPSDRMPEIRGRDIAMIFQEPMSSLNPVMTVEAQIAEAIMLHQQMSREDRRARVIELLRLVGIPDPQARMKAYPHQMSGGMRQRVMIAIAVACNPRLLIADEPTTALDVTIQAQVLDLLREVRQRLGTAVLMISHDLGVISELCDRIVVMYAGHVSRRRRLTTCSTIRSTPIPAAFCARCRRWKPARGGFIRYPARSRRPAPSRRVAPSHRVAS